MPPTLLSTNGMNHPDCFVACGAVLERRSVTRAVASRLLVGVLTTLLGVLDD